MRMALMTDPYPAQGKLPANDDDVLLVLSPALRSLADHDPDSKGKVMREKENIKFITEGRGQTTVAPIRNIFIISPGMRAERTGFRNLFGAIRMRNEFSLLFASSSSSSVWCSRRMRAKIHSRSLFTMSKQ
ncbi:hypothetical protein CEXT_780511 [Caerostris extrusa]|uniref:Uncharacterized protein n=1 Tax=Caerostris extrusa TaxID=172846 RepID=A0AAV4RE51_CAEEX|nr:hypothetical protein CEXT_780511 [Caerostris extrusa]